jgi:CheY-like chemotaxis protein
MGTILVVEDEPSLRQLAVIVLEDAGYSVLDAANGKDALRVVEEHGGQGIDLVVTDVIMPQMGGRELAERMKVTHPNIKILFMSGYTGDHDMHESLAKGGAQLLLKPFRHSDLTDKVREILASPSEL